MYELIFGGSRTETQIGEAILAVAVSLALMGLGLSLAVTGDLVGVATWAFMVCGIAFILSLSKLVRLFIRTAEAYARWRIKQWAEARGIDPDEVLAEE